MPRETNDEIVNSSDQIDSAPALFEDAYRSETPTQHASTKPPVTNADSFVQLFERNLPRIDSDHDRFISHKELGAAIQNSAFKGPDAQFIAVARAAFSYLSRMSNDTWTRTISETDIDAFEDAQEILQLELKYNQLLSSIGLQHFAALDSKPDDLISKRELDAAQAASNADVNKDPIEAEQRLWLIGLLKKNFDLIGRANIDNAVGISAADLTAFPQFVYEHTLPGAMNEFMTSSGETLVQLEHRLFADQENPLESIKPEAVIQGEVGDCYFMSALASLARNNPRAIQNMITDHANGEYTVTFPGREPIKVTAPTEAELILYARGGKYGVWPAVMEKAYGEYLRLPWTSKDTPAAENLNMGSATHDGLQVLTGTYANEFLVKNIAPSRMDAILKEAFANHMPVTAWTNQNTRDPHLPQMHEYAVLAYDPDTQKVTIYNPTGPIPEAGDTGEPMTKTGQALDGEPDGCFEMSLEHFYRYFTGIAI